MTFEEALQKLTDIKDQLDSPEITLDKSVSLYEESVKYTKLCLDMLKETEGKIVAVKSEIDKIIEKPLDTDKE